MRFHTGRKANEIIGAVLVALVAAALSSFRETFLSRILFIGVWLIAVIAWVLIKVKD
jgi:hypothetical protein